MFCFFLNSKPYTMKCTSFLLLVICLFLHEALQVQSNATLFLLISSAPNWLHCTCNKRLNWSWSSDLKVNNINYRMQTTIYFMTTHIQRVAEWSCHSLTDVVVQVACLFFNLREQVDFTDKAIACHGQHNQGKNLSSWQLKCKNYLCNFAVALVSFSCVSCG